MEIINYSDEKKANYDTQKILFRKIKNTIVSYIKEPIIIVSILLLIFIVFFLRPYLVPSGSMVPTLIEGDRIISIANYFPNGQTYKEGDIACFNANDGTVYVKRVIANGGDTVEISGDQLFVNGELSPWQGTGTGLITGKWVLNEDEYFMMGDNRGASHDSRWIGAIPADKFISKVYFIYFPFNHLALV